MPDERDSATWAEAGRIERNSRLDKNAYLVNQVCRIFVTMEVLSLDIIRLLLRTAPYLGSNYWDFQVSQPFLTGCRPRCSNPIGFQGTTLRNC